MTSPDSSIKLGSHDLSKLEYDQLKPGDFICTYEALTTQPELLFIKALFEFANQSRPPEFNKMFHTEVITHTYNRLGVYRIAHGDGMIQKIVSQDDNFRDHHPGQAFVVFRAKNKAVRREIINIANRTAEPGNGHGCRALYLNSLLHRKEYARNYFLFENSDSTIPTARKIAELAVNYDECGTFYHPDGSGEREMSCVQYVANIVNIAVLRILCPLSSSDQRSDKIDSLFKQILELNESNNIPFKFSHAHATPSGFVEFFLNNRSHFKTVGYLGAISECSEGPKLDIKGKAVQISPQMLIDSCAKNDSSNFQIDYRYVASVMKTLGMIDDRWRMYIKPATDPAKLQTLVVCLTARYPYYSSKVEIPSLLLRYAHQTEEIDFEDLPPITSPSFQDIKEILLLEREILRTIPMQSTEKTFKFAMNVFSSEIVAIQKDRFNLTQVFQSILMQSNSSIDSFHSADPLRLEYERRLKEINEKEVICQKKIDELLVLHEKIRENGCIILTSDSIPKGLRPWIHFSLNGNVWDVKPFTLQEGSWKANICIPKPTDVIYRLFIGPENREDPDPILKAQAWQQTTLDSGIFVPSDTIQTHLKPDFLLVDKCTHPQWKDEEVPLNRGHQLFTYQEKCETLAPFHNLPLTIDEYEKKYAELELNLKPIKVDDSFYEKQIIASLKIFLKAELGMNVSSKQIQFMKGGLGKGLSGDRIYVIFDSNHRPFLVVKVFMKSKGKFSREFLTLMNHEKLDLKCLKLPKVSAISAAEVGNQQIYFLATRYITGTSVYEMFTSLFDQQVGSSERQELLSNLLQIYAKLGEGIAEFHNAAKGRTLPMHPAFIDLLRKFSKNAFILFEEHLEPLFLKQLITYFENSFAYECERPFVRGYFHGDINAGNLIYNSVTDCLSLIDWPDGSSSVGQQGEPQGISFYDLIQIKNELATRKTQGLTEDEFSQLYRSFISSYSENGPLIPPTETMDFFSFIDLIGSIKWFLDKKGIFVKSQLSQAQKIYEFKLNELKTLLNSSCVQSKL